MAFAGLTVQNQLGFHELTNIIENASDNIFLDLDKSTRHVVYAVNDISIYFEGLDTQNPIPKNKFIDVDLLIIPKKDNIKLSFDPTFIWNDSNLSITEFNLIIGTNLSFYLHTIDSGTYWRISYSGTFGPDDGYSLVDTSTSQIEFEDIVYSPLIQNKLELTSPIILDFTQKIKTGLGKIIINEYIDPNAPVLPDEPTIITPTSFVYNYIYNDTTVNIYPINYLNQSNDYDTSTFTVALRQKQKNKTIFTLAINPTSGRAKYFNKLTSGSKFTTQVGEDVIYGSFYYNGKHYLSGRQDYRNNGKDDDCSYFLTMLNSDGSINKSVYITDDPQTNFINAYGSCISNNTNLIIGGIKWYGSESKSIPYIAKFDTDLNFISNRILTNAGSDQYINRIIDYKNSDDVLAFGVSTNFYNIDTSSWKLNYAYSDSTLNSGSEVGTYIDIDNETNDIYFTSHNSSNDLLDYLYKISGSDPSKYEYVKQFKSPVSSTKLTLSGIRYIDGFLYFGARDQVNNRFYICKLDASGKLVKCMETTYMYQCRVADTSFYLLNYAYTNRSITIMKIPFEDFETFNNIKISDSTSTYTIKDITSSCSIQDISKPTLTKISGISLIDCSTSISSTTYNSYAYNSSVSVLKDSSKITANEIAI